MKTPEVTGKWREIEGVSEALEFPPMKRLISTVASCPDDPYRSYKKKIRQLAFPYTLFMSKKWPGHGRMLHVLFCNSPVTDEGAEMFVPPLPHIEGDRFRRMPSYPDATGRVCQKYGYGTGMKLLDMISVFFGGRFKIGYHLQGRLIGDTSLKSYDKWERLTKEDLGFITEVNWGRTPLPKSEQEHKPLLLEEAMAEIVYPERLR